MHHTIADPCRTDYHPICCAIRDTAKNNYNGQCRNGKTDYKMERQKGKAVNTFKQVSAFIFPIVSYGAETRTTRTAENRRGPPRTAGRKEKRDGTPEKQAKWRRLYDTMLRGEMCLCACMRVCACLVGDGFVCVCVSADVYKQEGCAYT